ncbi:ATP-binding protein [Pseudomonas sp. Marseille-QA0892]
MNTDNSLSVLKLFVCAEPGPDQDRLVASLAERNSVERCDDISMLASRLDSCTGLILLTESMLDQDLSSLNDALSHQPDWSAIPLIVMGSSPEAIEMRVAGAFPTVTNFAILETEVSLVSLVSIVNSALRSRLRQFDMRDRLSELAEERSRLTTLLENLPVGVSFMNKDGRSLISNTLYRSFVPNDVIPSRDRGQTNRWIGLDENGRIIEPDQFAGARALRGETVTGMDFCFRTEAREFWTRVSAAPLYDEQGELIGAASMIVDINEEKHAQLALRRFNEELEAKVKARTQDLESTLAKLRDETAVRSQAEEQLRHSLKMEAVGQLTGGIAHDFNNMLTGVLGSLDLMRLRLAKSDFDSLPRYLDIAQASASRAAALTQRLLAFSRRQSLESRAMAIDELVMSLSELLRRTVTEQIRIEFELDSTVGSVLADSNQLENALLNLVINARDAMPDGGTIHIRTRPFHLDAEQASIHHMTPGDYICLDVQDTGTGIPPSLLDKVCDPFFTTKPQGQGTGLGLSMVYGFARQSRGRLFLSSEVGRGTLATICLPIASTPAVVNPQTVSQGAIGTGQHILVVEDDDSVRVINRDVLSEHGYQVHTVSNGQQALDILDSLPALDLLVTDVGLPGMNGRQLAEVMQQLRPRLPVLFVTGYAEGATNRDQFLGARMQLITKPFTPDLLLRTVDDILRNARFDAENPVLCTED